MEPSQESRKFFSRGCRQNKRRDGISKCCLYGPSRLGVIFFPLLLVPVFLISSSLTASHVLLGSLRLCISSRSRSAARLAFLSCTRHSLAVVVVQRPIGLRPFLTRFLLLLLPWRFFLSVETSVSLHISLCRT